MINHLPESAMIDSTLLRLADKEVIDDVENALKRFVEKRDVVVPLLNREHITKLQPIDLNILFDNTAMLAAGRESNFVKKQYKVFLVQLTFQLGFLYKNLFPEERMGNIIMMKMNNTSTRDVRMETKVLDKSLKEFFKGIDISILDTEESDVVKFWDIDVTAHFLKDLLKLGDLLSMTFEKMVK